MLFNKRGIAKSLNILLSGRNEIEKFLKGQPEVEHDWFTVKTKVVNERCKHERRRKKYQEDLYSA